MHVLLKQECGGLKPMQNQGKIGKGHLTDNVWNPNECKS